MAPKTPKQNQEIREASARNIQEAAFELFAKLGFSNTSISNIAQKADISKGLIYHYFDSKQDILKQIFDSWTGQTEYMFDFSDDAAPCQKMEQLITEVFAFIKQQPQFSRFMMALAMQPDAVEKLESSIKKVTLAQIHTAADILCDLGYDQPEEEAYYIGAQLDGISFGYLTLGDEYPLDDMKQKMITRYVSDD